MTKGKYIRKGFAAALALTIMTSGMGALSVSAVDTIGANQVTDIVSPVEELKNNSSVNFETLGVKKYLKIYGSASGGSGDYTYAYLYKKQADTKWSVKKNYSDTQEKAG